ncbi:MAG TPA: efflux transporter outer membrane subunit [Burkholderiales bacterium]|nr:efflux transporter outer membrane subunit [Burkholderiales bacterium]
MLHRITGLAAAAAFIGGCTLGPAYERPSAELPVQWQEPQPQGIKAPPARWWTMFGDPALDRLVEEALVSNQDLALATARVDEARALSDIADSQRMPTVDATFERDRFHFSERAPVPIPSNAIESNSYRAKLNVAYEVDLWGRLRSASRAARAELLASEADRETVRITLATEVVRAYFALVALDAQVEATRRSLALRAEGLDLQRVRIQAGLINEFALRQLEAEVAAARAQLPALEANRTAQELALAVLLGRSPRAIMEGAVERRAGLGEPAAAVVPEGLPSDLLLRRPDVVSAEQVLIANNARISEARAALFPRIGLSGYLGSESTALSDLFSGPAGIWSLGFALAQPIFQGGRLFAEVDAVKARERQAVARYQKTLQEAFREVRQALYTQVKAREAFEAESARTVALQEALRLSRIRYQNGLLSLLEVLDSERNLLQAELNRSDALRVQRAAVADLVKALGGGWQGFEAEPVAQGPSATKP